MLTSHRHSSGTGNYQSNMTRSEKKQKNEMLQGTLDMLEVEQGSLYPALHRLEDRGWLSSYWGASENNRKAKFYKLTAAGRKQLIAETGRWRQLVDAIGRVLGEVEG